MSTDRATSFLQMIRRSQRGRLKVYLGYGPGVGKTYQMLLEGQRLKQDGIDVVVGFVETHGRVETARLVEGLEVVPRRRVEYREIVVEEMDLDAVLARRPQVALVDELAHTNVPGSRNEKRYQDVQEILAAGIHVITTLNLQHLESLYNTVEGLVGVKVRERLPDSVLAEADQVVNVDLAPEDLQRRLQEGKIYPRERIASALENFFQSTNLEHLRELTLRELASQIDHKRREVEQGGEDAAPDQIMVCLSSRGPNSARLLRYASRLAGRLNRNWYAVNVQTPSEEPTAIDATVQRLLSDTLTLANQLGAMVFTFKGQDVADTILRFAREYRVGHVVIGRPGPVAWWRRLLGHRSVVDQLIRRAEGVTLVVVDAEADERLKGGLPAPEPAGAHRATSGRLLGDLLDFEQVVIWDDPASKQQVFRKLLEAIAAETPEVDLQRALQALEDRERQGSMFLNEGVALPHARVAGLTRPHVALGLTRAGILDAPLENPVEVVFLLLSSPEDARMHLQLLVAAARALQSRDLRRKLTEAGSAAAALTAIRDWEASRGPRAASG
ncbi:MAG: PTS sugar transporter subunit IIA [Candidatus Latescibacteria bacterium]|nr:PTS sugar transporter subunit IIA [Candidatus Latescibacterota bacterium]